LLVDPIANCLFEFIQAVFEEVSCAWDDYKPDVSAFFKFGSELSQLFDVAKLIVLAMHEKQRLAASFEEFKVVLIERRADADQELNAIVIDSNVQPDARAERETADGDTDVWILLLEVI
jgi:hypothetical protein